MTAIRDTVREFGNDIGISAEAAETFLRGRAAQDPEIEAAFYERDANPEQWKRALAQARTEYKRIFGNSGFAVAPDIDETKDAIRAAARVVPDYQESSDHRSEAQKAKDMTDDEYRDAVRGLR